MDASILYSERLVLRPIEQRDWPVFRELHIGAEVERYVREVQSEPAIIAKFQDRLKPWRYESGEWLTLVVETLDGEFWGVTGFYGQNLQQTGRSRLYDDACSAGERLSQ